MGHRHQPAVTPPAPEEFIRDLLFREHSDNHVWRPALDQAFNVRLPGPPFNDGLIWRSLLTVTGLTAGRVGWVQDASREPEVEFVWAPSDQAITSQGAIAATYQRVQGGLCTGGRIVYGLADWLDSPKVVLHELGHVLGFGHAYRDKWGDGPFIMGNAPRDTTAFHPWERDAWNRAAALQPGAGAFAVGPATRTHVCTLAEVG